MRFILAGHDALVADWVCQRNPCLQLSRDGFSAIGLMDAEGSIVAGCVYDVFRGYDIQMHIAAIPGGKWMTRTYLQECFRYPFEQLKVARITGLVAASNLAAQRFDEHLGFKFEGRVRHGLPSGEDLLIYGMLKSECRWLASQSH